MSLFTSACKSREKLIAIKKENDVPSITPPGFYDRWTPSSNWKRHLFRVGTPLQTAELNEIQQVLGYETESVATSLYKEGAILAGTSIDINAEDASNVIVTITPGKVYAEGYTHKHSGGEVEITGRGTEIIGLVLTTNVVTHVDDSSLLDPAVGSEGYQLPGAHRMVFSYEWVVNNNNAVRIAEIIDGSLNQTYDQARPISDAVYKILAQRTYEESGNYSVEPFNISVEDLRKKHSLYNTRLRVKVSGGIAFVRGSRIQNNLKYLDITRPINTYDRLDEPTQYTTGTVIYDMALTPVREVTQVAAQVNSGVVSITRDPTDPIEGDGIPIAYQPIISIVSIAGYTSADYSLDAAKTHILWTGATKPAAGASYNVTFIYKRQMIKGLRVRKRISNETVIHNGTTHEDSLAQDDIAQVVSINNSFSLALAIESFPVANNARKVKWITADAPNNGASYQITYDYWDHTVEGDYIGRDSFRDTDGTTILYDEPQSRLLRTSDTDGLGLPVDYTKQVSYDTSGEKPVDTTTVDYDYKRTIPRTDILAVDNRGIFSIIKGEDSLEPRAPSFSDTLMGIAKLHLGPEARRGDVLVENFDNQRVDMEGLRTIQRLLKRVLYNQAVSQLYQNAIDNNPKYSTQSRQAVFADDFSSLRFADDTFDVGVGDDRVKSACTIDPLQSSLAIAQELEAVDFSRDGTKSTAVLIDGHQLLPYSEVEFITQPFATNTIQVNALGKVNIGARIILTPAFDRWSTSHTRIISRDVVHWGEPLQIRRQITLDSIAPQLAALEAEMAEVTRIARANSRARGRTTLASNRNRDAAIARNAARTAFNARAAQQVADANRDFTQIQTANEWAEIALNIQLSSLPLARESLITINGTRFIGGEDNIAAYLNGDQLVLTALAPSVAGTLGDTVAANASGVMKASFRVPPNTLSGTHLIEISGESDEGGDANTKVGSYGSASFSSQGTHEAISRFVTNHRELQRVSVREEVVEVESVELEGVPELRRRRRRRVDPVAQTFIVGNSTWLTSVGVYFSTKPEDSSIPIECLLMTTGNGVPTSTILGEAALTAVDVNVSDDASAETKFTFNHPVFLDPDREYAFVLRTDDSLYQIHYSEVGERDPNLGWVNQNPHSGVMLISANLSTWTPFQSSDVKFSLYRASFTQTEAIVHLGQTTLTAERSRFEFQVGNSSPTDGTDIIWEYSFDDSTWQVFNPFEEIEELNSYTTIYIRARLIGNERVSPVIFNDAFAQFYSWKSTGKYISLAFPFDVACRYVEVWLDVKLPGEGSTTSATLKTRIGDSGTWTDMVHETTEDSSGGDGYILRHYTVDLGTGLTEKNCRIRIDMTSSNVSVSPEFRRLRAICLEHV